LEPLRHLPHLRRLQLLCYEPLEADFPPFLPPSLKALDLTIYDVPLLESLLRELPSMLRGGGASLEEVDLWLGGELPAECGAALAQVLRTCSSPLRTLKVVGGGDTVFGTACTCELAPGLVSCCDTLEVLECHWAIFSALPATCPTFPRLNELNLEGAVDKNVDLASPAWDIMANGRLPALATLEISIALEFFVSSQEGEGASKGFVVRLSRALEAVAGTLKRLTFIASGTGDLPAGAPYELGSAIGKLRRLRHLDLSVSMGGWGYHAVARGMAASGGCPQLFELEVHRVRGDFEFLTHEPSLIVPSVRDLAVYGRGTEEEALLLCCAMVQAPYKYRLTIGLFDPDMQFLPSSALACMRAILRGGGLHADLR
jgi:hypothetical protein